MKKLLVLSMLFVAGCAALETATPSNPWGSIDPNAVQGWLTAAVAAGQAAQPIGLVIGQPAIIGGGILVSAIAGALLATVAKKKEGG